MSDKPTTETWVTGCIAKRTPDALRILMDLVQAGLRNGECSALDVRDVHFDEPNIIGCTMRLLPKLGFVHTDRRVANVIRRKHYRRVDMWELRERYKAELFIDKCRGRLLEVAQGQANQLRLAM
jgi:hypothetical protein